MINGLLLKLLVLDTAKHSTEEVFGKSKEAFQAELDEFGFGDRIDLLESYGEVVDETFEDGGRWTNYRTRVFRFWHEREYVFISVSEEVPATEMQEGGDFSDPTIVQVYPHKVESTVYKTEKAVKK